MSRCIEVVFHSRIKLEENRMKAVFLNPERREFKIGRIDGCLIEEGIRADYFVSGLGCSVVVELKGADIEHACKQVFVSARHEKVRPHLEGNLSFVIICSRVPSYSSAVQFAQVRAKKEFDAKLKVYTRERELNICGV